MSYLDLLKEVERRSLEGYREVEREVPTCAESAVRAVSDSALPGPRRAAIVAALVGDFAQHGGIHEVRVPGVPDTLFIVPTIEEGERLVALERVSRGRIWTARELADVLTARLSPTDFSAVALAKLALDGEVVATMPRTRPRPGR